MDRSPGAFVACCRVIRVCAVKTSPNIIRIFPDWIGEAAYFIYFLHFGVIFYGIRKRKLIYWKITPLLIWSFVLVYVSFPLYGAILGLLPWAAGLLVLTVFPL
ncbi:MAG TPA: hypothetical protein VGR70_00225, partial [Stellaceae bacterium]|nr:hypothetical protein [Stellaceae bacterium]